MSLEHGLWFEGAPHDDQGHRILNGGRWAGVGGEGRAACRCGALSPVLPSAYQRKAWHREHKAAMSTTSETETTTDDRAVRLALEVARLTTERDMLRAAYDDLEAARLETMDQRNEARATLARVEALADVWEADDEESLNTWGQHLMGGSVLSCAEHLRAALEGPA